MNDTMHLVPVDVTVARWRRETPPEDLVGLDLRERRALYNIWAHRTLQGAQARARGLTRDEVAELFGD